MKIKGRYSVVRGTMFWTVTHTCKKLFEVNRSNKSITLKMVIHILFGCREWCMPPSACPWSWSGFGTRPIINRTSSYHVMWAPSTVMSGNLVEIHHDLLSTFIFIPFPSFRILDDHVKLVWIERKWNGSKIIDLACALVDSMALYWLVSCD
jgi:hypothetical protein